MPGAEAAEVCDGVLRPKEGAQPPCQAQESLSRPLPALGAAPPRLALASLPLHP